MELHLIRHAKAEPSREGQGDESRALTRRGHEQARALAGFLDEQGVKYDVLLTSPKLRALETTTPLERLARVVKVEQLLAEEPGEPLLAVLRGLRPSGEGIEGAMAVVGHEPYLTRLAALILLGDAAQGERFHLRKAGVLALRWPGAASLEWLVGPSVYGAG
ncbi:MAG TPA: histidine phosphatase family protein [Deinococcales bacterium]|nr:histidine phosphatase family protein [Deinococcales bacterium]